MKPHLEMIELVSSLSAAVFLITDVGSRTFNSHTDDIDFLVDDADATVRMIEQQLLRDSSFSLLTKRVHRSGIRLNLRHKSGTIVYGPDLIDHLGYSVSRQSKRRLIDLVQRSLVSSDGTKSRIRKFLSARKKASNTPAIVSGTFLDDVWHGFLTTLRFGARLSLRFKHHRSTLILVQGPDGVGKSTIISRSIADFNLLAITVLVVHCYPRLFKREKKLDHLKPHTSSQGTRSIITSLAKLVFFLLTMLVTRVVLIQLRLRGGILVMDRSVFDYAIMPARARLRLPRRLLLGCFKFFHPRPTLIINLTAPSEIILARKKELTEQEIEYVLNEYAALPRRLDVPWATIDTTQSIEESVRRFVSSSLERGM